MLCARDLLSKYVTTLRIEDGVTSYVRKRFAIEQTNIMSPVYCSCDGDVRSGVTGIIIYLRMRLRW
jgi:hypothetical protein